MWRDDRTTDISSNMTGDMSVDRPGEGRDHVATIPAANRRINLQSGQQTDQRIGNRIDRETDRKIGRRFDRATTSLTPYGMSFWALILAACGGGGGGGGGPATSAPTPAPAAPPRMVEKSGFAYNRPLEGGVAWLDVNENQRIDGGDIRLGTVNAQGEYRGQVPEAFQNRPVMIDTRGTKYANELPDTLLSSPRAQVVSPLTHGLVTGEIKQDDLPNPGEFDPYNDNPYQEPPASEDSSEANREARREIFKAVKDALLVVGRNLSRTESTPPKNGQTPAPAADNPLTEALEKLKGRTEDIEFDPVLTRSGNFTLDLAETTSSSAADTGLRFAVTDADGNFTGPPTVSDDRFELRQVRQEWQLWVKPGQTFNANETISLNIIATDTTSHLDIETVRITVEAAPVEPAAPPVIASPSFSSQPVGTDLMEHETGQGAQVYDAAAAVGAGSSGRVRFSLKNEPSYLTINAATGVVTLTGPVDLDAGGAASRRVSFTVVATDSADTGRTSEQQVSFTITNSDEQPTGMTLTRIRTSLSESADKANGIELARVTFDDKDNPVPAGQSNGVGLAVSGGGHRLSAQDFEVRGGVIYLKATANTAVSADATVTVTVTPVTSGEGTRPLPQNFTFTITNDAPPPEPVVNAPPTLTITSPASQAIVRETIGEAVTSGRIDTGISVVARDPEGNLQPLVIERQKADNSWVADDRFVVQGGKLWVEAGKKFDYEHTDNPRGAVTLRITASDGTNDVQGEVTVQLTNEDDPTVPEQLSVGGLTNGSVQTGSQVTAQVRLSDPDDSDLDIVFRWQKKVNDSWADVPNEIGQSYTPRQGQGDYRLKVTATDSTHAITSSFYSEFTVTAPPTNRPPTAMSFKDNVSSLTIDEAVETQAQLLATIEFTDPDTTAAFLNNMVRLKSVGGSDTLPPSYGHDLFEIRNGNELWLKADSRFDFENLRPSSGTQPARLPIVLEHVPGADEEKVADLSFTLNVANVQEAPVVNVSSDTSNPVPITTTDAFDTGVLIWIFDPDSLPGDVKEVTTSVSDAGFRPQEVEEANYPRGSRYDPKVKLYRLMVDAGQSFTPGQTINVVITANDSTGEASLVTKKTVTITILPATSETLTSPQVTTGQPLQWTDGRGTDQQPDIHNLNKDNYGAEEQAVLIRTVETHDRIMVDLPYVLVRSGFGRVADSTVRGDQRKDVLYSPHDVSLNDNVLAVVSEYFGRLGPFWDFGSLRSADDESQSYFAPRPDGSATLDYVIREQGSLEGGRNSKIYGSSNQRDAFLFDGSPSAEATAPKFGEFDYAQGDRLLFTGPENSTIYSQVRYVSDTSSFELVFYSSAQVANNNILAIFDVSAIYNQSSGKWAAGIEVSDPKNANLFLDVNTPTLVDIPVERKYYFSGEGRVELNEEMRGAQFVADYFTSIPYNNRAMVINDYNNAVLVQLRKVNTVPVIRGFEDGHDKIFLEPGQNRSIWWGESNGNIILYNVAKPSNDSHKIAIIEEFEGTFSHADFVTVDDTVEGFPYIDVSADLIVPL